MCTEKSTAQKCVHRQTFSFILNVFHLVFQKPKPKISASRRLFLKVFHALLPAPWQSGSGIDIFLSKLCIFRLTLMSFCACVRPNCWRRPWLCWTARSKAEKKNEREPSLRGCQRSKCQACLCRIYRYLSPGSESSSQYVTDETSTQWERRVLWHPLHSGSCYLNIIVKNSQSN